jgi:hypothetical protein
VCVGLYPSFVCVFSNSILLLAASKCAMPDMMLYFPIVSHSLNAWHTFLFLHSYRLLDSGHGVQTKDLDRDEADGFDEGEVLFYFK